MTVELMQPIIASLNGNGSPMQNVQACTALLVFAIGLGKAVSLTSSFLRFAWRQLLRPGKKLKHYGKWAIVTGSTDGIGRQYCNVLAKQGMNVYLVSRTEAKLKAAAEEIAAAYSVETKYYAADLVAAGAEGAEGATWAGLRASLAGMDIGLLINNAGMSYEHPEYVHSIGVSTIDDLVHINISALSKMVHTVLPGMKERGRGCIVNLSSGVSSALPSCPLLAVYAATKAYVDSFSTSLAREYSQYGIQIQAQSPAFVATKMAKIRNTSITVPSPLVWATAAVRHIGYEAQAFPYAPHAIMTACMQNMPVPLVNAMWLSIARGGRSKALKKKQATAKAE